MSDRVVVLAGGLGSRLLPYRTVVPKPLLPVGNRSVIEVILGQLAALDAAHALERARILAEEPPDGVRVQPLGLAEVAERVEHVRCQDAAVVDQKTLHPFAISRAFSASIGTPRSNRPRYSSSEFPAWKRL